MRPQTPRGTPHLPITSGDDEGPPWNSGDVTTVARVCPYTVLLVLSRPGVPVFFTGFQKEG